MKTIPYTEKDFTWVKMTPLQMKKGVDAYLAHKKRTYAEIKKILPEHRTFLNTIYALERCDDPSMSLFGKLGVLSEASPKEDIRNAAHTVAMEASQKMVDIEYDRGMFIAVTEYYEGNFRNEKKKLRKEDIKLIEDTLREYRRMGFELPTEKQKKIKVLMKKMSKLGTAFRKTITDYQDYILCTEEEMEGLSPRFIESLPRHTDGRYIVSLQYPHTGPFMAEATNRIKREELALKNLKKGGAKNLKVIAELVGLRAEMATILGYKHHADFKTENRMAKTGKVVEEFHMSLLKKLIPLAKKDMEMLKGHAQEIGIKKLEHFDTAYVATSLKKKLYDLDPETVRAYFPLDHVRTEMFALCERLFGLSIKEIPLKLWHKDVRSYQVNNKDGSLVGYFAMDMFPRVGKFGHAAMFDVVVPHEASYQSEEYVAPLSVMMCNFRVPSKKTPSLLSVYEVEVLFHEFGHCLHMTLSRSKLESQSGANVTWDFVETPSQIMENWVWDAEVMSKLSKQYETGKSLPKDMVERLVKGKNFQNAQNFVRQLMYGLIDMGLHTGKIKDPELTYRKMTKKYLGIDLPEKETLMTAGFGHLVGYDAGYYSYLWALVYACDAFESFKTKGNKNLMTTSEVGTKWRREVLEKGSSEDEMKLIQNFLGRKPNDKAFLKEVIGK
jgi:thimet oligopeptidase